MSDWVEKPLRSLVSFKKGKKVDTSDLALDGYQPYLGASSLTGGEDGFAIPSGGVTCAESDALMLWDGERSGLVGPGKHGVISSTVMRLRPEAEMSGRYLVHCLRDRFDWIQARRTGTGVPHVPKDLGRILNLCFPNEDLEQATICDVLDAIDAQIETTEAFIAKQERVRAGLMQDLFTRGVDEHGELRPPREQAPHLYHQTELGWLPVGWDVGPLIDYAAEGGNVFVNGPFGSDLLSSELKAEGIPVIYVRDISNEAYDRVSTVCVTQSKANQLAFCSVKRGDLLIAKVGDPPCMAAPYTLDAPAIVTQDVMRLRPAKGGDHIFLASLLNSSFGVSAIRKIIVEGTRSRVSLTEFKKLRVPMPPVYEREKIGGAIASILKLGHSYKVELENFRLQKSGLMQDLLTGKVSVAPLLESATA